MGGTPRGAGAERDREGVVEAKHYRLITVPVPYFLELLGGKRQKRVDGGECVFSFFSVFLTET